MAKMFSENAQTLLTFLQGNPVVDITANELSEATGVPTKSVNGIITSLQKKGIAYREPAEVDGKTVKFIRLTEAGKTVDPNADKPEPVKEVA